jgi:aldehyde:ferredoxin oxidoreductase
LINAACGLDWTIEDMMKAGERAWNIKRAINNRMGLTAENDKLPKALLEPFRDGGSEGFVPTFRECYRILRSTRLGSGNRQAYA